MLVTDVRMSGSPPTHADHLSRLYDPAYVRHVDVAIGAAPVQVCLDSRMLRDAAGTGVATYARMLGHSLPAAGAVPMLLDDGAGSGLAPRARPRRWLAAVHQAPREAVLHREGEAAPPLWTAADIFKEAQVFFNLHGRLLPIAFADPPAVMHWTYPLPLFAVGSRNLYTIHDLIPLTAPALTDIPEARHRAMLRRIAARAHRLVTVSEAMRQAVIAHCGVGPQRVVNTYQAVEAPIQADPPLPPGLRSGRYFLFCGRVEARKNLARLTAAHAASATAVPLVVVGPSVPGEQRLEAVLAHAPNVIRLPWVPRAELLGLIRRARALLFPSLAEGFGLPIAEAMTLGCPVLTADRGATAEIAGDAALLVDPEDDGALAAAIALLAADNGQCARLRALGFARGRMFAPAVYARRLRALYAEALAAPGVDDQAGTAL